MKKLALIILTAIILLCSCVSNKPYPETYVSSVDLIFSDAKYGMLWGPYINIEIDNTSYLAFFDIGISHTALTLDQLILDNLDVSPTGEKSNYLSARGIFQAEKYIIPSVTINDDIFLANVSGENMADLIDEKVLAGLPLFEQYNILLSYKQEKIFLYEKNSDLDFLKSWTKVPLLEDKKGLFFYGNIPENSKQYIFYLDTGNYGYRNGEYSDNVYNQELGAILREKNRLDYKIGDRIFKHNYFYFVGDLYENVPIDVFLSYSFLSKYDVYIDLDNHCLYIER
jgi:hypothetical protein